MGILVFISYATKDAETFQIKTIAEGLTACSDIEDVLYWQEDVHDDIYAYMNENLGKCDVFILFCSPNSTDSIPVNKEWHAADALNKPIIPVFTSSEHIPPLLRSRLGIQIDVFNVEDNIKKLYSLILKKAPREDDITLQFKLPKSETETVQTKKSTSLLMSLINICVKYGLSVKNILVTTDKGERIQDDYFDETISTVTSKFGTKFKILIEQMQIIANFKVCIVGDEKSGKSKLLEYCIEKKHADDEYKPTVGVDFWVKPLNYKSPEKNFEISLIFWDLGGSFEQFDNVKLDLFNDTDGIILVGDLTSKESFEAIANYWMPNIRKNLNEEIPLILLANKCDLEHSVTKEELEDLAKKLGIGKVFLTSAKTGENVDVAFKSLVPPMIARVMEKLEFTC